MTGPAFEALDLDAGLILDDLDLDDLDLDLDLDLDDLDLDELDA